MRIKSRLLRPRQRLPSDFFTPPACIATGATISTVASLVAAVVGNLGVMSPAMAERDTHEKTIGCARCIQ